MSSHLSDNLSQSDIDLEERPFQIYGMFFCGSCQNLMTPISSNIERTQKLEFDCKQCKKKEVDFSRLSNQECVIYNKELKPGSRITKLTKQLVLDPTLCKITGVECPECENDEAFYLMTPGEGENCLEIKLICAATRVGKCDGTWVMGPELHLIENLALPKDQK